MILLTVKYHNQQKIQDYSGQYFVIVVLLLYHMNVIRNVLKRLSKI